ncbi:unnamed protein product [Cunninghamella blakesleeana]
MSWNNFSQQFVNPENLALAEKQVDEFMDLFNRIVSQCRTKCIPNHYREPDLHKGEMVCIDCCVVKYLKMQQVLGVKMQEAYPDTFSQQGPLNNNNNNTNNNNSYESTF